MEADTILACFNIPVAFADLDVMFRRQCAFW